MARNRYKVQAFDVVGENFAGEFLILSSLHGPLSIGTRRQNNMRVGDRLEHHEFEIVGETTVRWTRFVETAANTPLHRTESGPVNE
ncbi:MAG: hypothetical protein KF861_08645 [Planctomycetaceae bacterium]|nr:hypothetical protein [Planctomycetaceae bacterium]